MFNQYTPTHCKHQMPTISCSKCNSTQPQVYNQMETQIKNYEEQLKAYKELVKSQKVKICELTKELEYANQTIENTELPIRWMHINGQVIHVENPDDFDMGFFTPLYTHPQKELIIENEVLRANLRDVANQLRNGVSKIRQKTMARVIEECFKPEPIKEQEQEQEPQYLSEPIAYCENLEEDAMIEAAKKLGIETTEEKFLDTPLYTHPQKELSDEEIAVVYKKVIETSGHNFAYEYDIANFARAIIKASRG